MRTIFIAVLITIGTIVPAFAATVDITDAALSIITIVFGLLVVVAKWVGGYVVSWLAAKAKVEDQMAKQYAKERLNEILYAGISRAEAWAKEQVQDPNSSITKLKIDNIFVAKALEYGISFLGKEPDGIYHMFNLTDEKVKDMIIQRLNTRFEIDEEIQVPVSTSKQIEVIEN